MIAMPEESREPWDFWNIIVALTYIEKSITLYKDMVPSPYESGLFTRSIGKPAHQIADLRTYKLGIDSCVHLVELRDRYVLHVDSYDPLKHPGKHMLYDLILRPKK